MKKKMKSLKTKTNRKIKTNKSATSSTGQMSCSAPSTNSTRDRALESLRELETTLTTISKTLALEVEKLKITEVHIQILSPSRQPQKPAYLT